MARPVRGKPQSDMSRLRRHAMNTLGVIYQGKQQTAPVFRSDRLDILDQYYDSTQYDDLTPWDQAQDNREDYTSIRKRKPRIIYNLPKLMVDKVASKLVGSSVFPQFVIEDDDDDTAFFRTVQKACQFRRAMIEPAKQLLKSGSVFVRYYLVNGVPKIEGINSKYCYPKFDALGELEEVEVKYVYEDWEDRDEKGEPRRKWYRILLGKVADIAYDSPNYQPGVKPEFHETARAGHGLGWVQGVWLVTHEEKWNPDGASVFGEILDFIDELNYSLSQGSQAASYNQEPQLTVNGIDEDELELLIKSSERAWNLGKEGEAKFVESQMEGVVKAMDLRDKMRQHAFEVARIVINDPDKMKGGQVQSGEAMKQLYAPLIELVDELRAIIEPKLISLLTKIAITLLHYNAMGEETILEAPDGYMPTSLDVTVQWPPIFPPTLADIGTAATAANLLSQGGIISRESLTRWIAQMIPSVDNIEEELKKIETQEPLPSPFGTFDQGGM